jgi:hypothetical protein
MNIQFRPLAGTAGSGRNPDGLRHSSDSGAPTTSPDAVSTVVASHSRRLPRQAMAVKPPNLNRLQGCFRTACIFSAPTMPG